MKLKVDCTRTHSSASCGKKTHQHTCPDQRHSHSQRAVTAPLSQLMPGTSIRF